MLCCKRDSSSQYSLGFNGRPAAPRIGRLQVALIRETKENSLTQTYILIKDPLHGQCLGEHLYSDFEAHDLCANYLMLVGVFISLARISSTTLSLAFCGVSSVIISSTTCQLYIYILKKC